MRSFITSYISQNVIRLIRPKRIKWAGHLERMGQTKNAYNPEEKRALGSLGADEKILLKWVLRKFVDFVD
jgi:hypothetical protein